MISTQFPSVDKPQIQHDSHMCRSITRNGKNRYSTVIFDSNGNPKIPLFSNVQVSTMTVIVYTNLTINIQNTWRYLPTTPWTIVKKKRGRKRKVHLEDPNKDVPPGSIISLKHKKKIRGVELKPSKAGGGEYWKHSVCAVMVLEGMKTLNVKVSSNGKLQMTGCKSMRHAIDFVKHLYSLMIEAEEWSGESLFTYRDDSADKDEAEQESIIETSNIDTTDPLNNGLVATFKCVMKNIDFGAGYTIRRNRLDTLINHHTDFRSIFESSIGTSVNIKLKASHHSDSQIYRLRITGEGEIVEDTISYEEFFYSLPIKNQKEEQAKESYHTFLVFASGRIIMSSAGREMEPTFYKLVKLLVEYRRVLEEAPEDETIDSQWLNEPLIAIK